MDNLQKLEEWAKLYDATQHQQKYTACLLSNEWVVRSDATGAIHAGTIYKIELHCKAIAVLLNTFTPEFIIESWIGFLKVKELARKSDRR